MGSNSARLKIPARSRLNKNMTNNNPKISVCVPIHDMTNGDKFLWRLVNSLTSQTFRDWELIITKEGHMAENTNVAIKKARGEIIKILYLDDYLAHPDSLKVIVDNFKGGWLATGCLHDDGISVGSPHFPEWNDDIFTGNNTIGSPSVIAIENNNPLLFDENMSWMLDVDYYTQLYDRYGEPTLVNDLNVVLGIGSHQMTQILTNDEKLAEYQLINQKYAK